MQKDQYHTYWFIIPVLCFAAILGIMAIDLNAPSLPWIARSLHASPYLVRLTVPFNSYGVAVGAFIFGALLDAFGRKKPIIMAMIAYIIISLLCALSPTIHILLLLRFTQGFCLASMFVGYRAIVADVYGPVNKVHHAMATIGMFVSMSPIFAPSIGGYLQHIFGWQANFIFLAIYGFLVVCALSILPETHWQRTPIRHQQISKRYIKILATPRFWLGIMFMCVGTIVVSFAIIGSFLIQDVLGYSAIVFGHTALCLGILCFIGSYVYRLLLRHFALAKILIFNTLAAIVTAIIFVMLATQWKINYWTITLPVAAIFFFISCAGIYQVGTGICTSLFPEMAGTVGAVSAIIFLLISSVIISIASFLKAHTATPLAMLYLIVLITLFILTLVFRDHLQKN
ncbi:MAG: MFS transporter [Pseudomonadota bacterium]